MQNRFHADPRVQAAELLLQERIPHLVPLKNPPIEKAEHIPATRRLPALLVRRYVTPHTLSPRTHFLSNGSYAVMLTNAGGGYSRRQNLAMTRWREDITADAWGTFIYVRDLDSRRGLVDDLSADRTGTGRVRGDVCAGPRHLAARRRGHRDPHRNRRVAGRRRRAAAGVGDQSRPRGAQLRSHQLCRGRAGAGRRRPGASGVQQPVRRDDRRARTRRADVRPAAAQRHRPAVPDSRAQRTRSRWATRRSTKPIARGSSAAARGVDRPTALYTTDPLSNTTGPVLDPIVSLRQSVRIPPGGTARIAFTTGFADNEDGARQLIEKYHDRRAVARALALASTHSQIELRHLGLTIEETMRFQRLSGRLMYGDPRLRAADAVRRNTRGQAELWKYGISGDLPILLVHLEDGSEVGAAARPAQGARVSPAQGPGLRSRRAERPCVQLSAGPAEHAAADGREQS